MSIVYFKALDAFDEATVSVAAKQLLTHLIMVQSISLNKKVPIKVHFGEKGSTTFVSAKCYDGIIDVLQEKAIATNFIETNVLYRGERTTREKHIKVAQAHGFTRIPIEIADGDHGEEYYQVPIEKDYFKFGKYGLGYRNYDQIIVCSHFKGHAMAGFGGAIKQLSMGFASRGGKMAQHAKLVPAVKANKCVSCGACIKACDVHAISMNQTANIAESLCIGCAGCIAICPVGAISNDWESENFKEKVTEYAYGAQLGKSFIYLNFLMNITKDCDCVGRSQQLLTDDIGVLISTDPVAIDKACYDLLAASHGEALFTAGLTQIKHAERIGFGDAKYQLIEL